MPENKKKTRGNLAVMGRLVGLVKPLAPVMVSAVLLGVAGFLCAIFITVLGAYALLRADGVEPVLILDDVFAELDEVRRERLAERIAGAEQVIITAAVASDVPASLAGKRWIIHEGTVTLDADE